jgi:hypothetical protein
MKSKIDRSPEIEIEWSKLGYPPETLRLLLLVPLVQTAWAEGFVQACERKTILKFAEELEVNGAAAEYLHLLEWFENRPSEEFFARATELLRGWLAEMPPEQSEKIRRVLFAGCFDVASASTEIGIKKQGQRISREERRELGLIGEKLGLTGVFAGA